MIGTGGVKVGDRIVCPDGPGTITKVFDQDNVMVKLDRGPLAAFDLEKCAREDDPKASDVLG